MGMRPCLAVGGAGEGTIWRMTGVGGPGERSRAQVDALEQAGPTAAQDSVECGH